MKPVFQVLFGLIAILTLGALVLSFSLDGMVKSNIENTTSEMLDTSVEVNGVAISILDGTGTIKGVTVHNPEGFSNNPAAKLQQISMKVDLYSLLSDTIIVKEIQIQKPHFYYEQKVSGSNLNTLTDNLGGSSSSGTSLIVDHLLVENGRVTLTAEIGGENTVEGNFSNIEVEGIGRNGNNTVEQTIKEILEPILKKAAEEAIKQGMMDKAKDAVEGLLDG